MRTKRTAKSLRHRYEASMLYISQDGRCALCTELLDHEGGWHDHHIVYKVNGGSDAMSNRVLLHPVPIRGCMPLGCAEPAGLNKA